MSDPRLEYSRHVDLAGLIAASIAGAIAIATAAAALTLALAGIL